MPGPFGGQSQQRWGDNSINANEYLRDIMLTDMTGRATSTADARRKGMLALAFFDTTSPSSHSVMPCLQKLADAYKEAGKLTVLGISANNRELTKSFLDEHGVKFPILLDHDGYHAMIYGLASIPTVFLADATGLVIRKMVGFNGSILNEMSASVATFSAVEPVILVETGAESLLAVA